MAIVDFTTYGESIKKALDAISAAETLAEQKNILIKPNLTNSSPHPVTTPKECCEAIIVYIRECSDADIVIGEGCGDSLLETDQVFQTLAYTELVDCYDIKFWI